MTGVTVLDVFMRHVVATIWARLEFELQDWARRGFIPSEVADDVASALLADLVIRQAKYSSHMALRLQAIADRFKGNL
jgi:hypothetical protein